MIKKFLFLWSSAFLLSSSSFLHSSAPAVHPDFLPPKPLANESKKEFINFLHLIQDYSVHAQNLVLLLENNRFQIKKLLKKETKNYKKTLANVDTLEKNSEAYQQKLSYIKNNENALKPLAELKKEENNLNPNNVVHLIEALYLLSIAEKDIKENQQLGKKTLSLQFHPDRNLAPEEKTDSNINYIVYTEAIKNINALLTNNTPNEGLNKLQTQIQGIIIPEASPVKKNITDLATFLTSVAAQNIGYETITRMMPNRIQEAQLYQQCIGSLTGTNLILYKKMTDLHTKQ